MTTYFVGVGGNNGNAGTSWALRRASIASGFTLLAAGDALVIGPGTYRENPSTGVNGSSGSPITVIGDEGGTLTDGIGGAIRITGSDNDQTIARANAVTCANNWWAFRGLHLDSASTLGFNITGNNITVDQCVVQGVVTSYSLTGSTCTNVTIKRCVSLHAGAGISCSHTGTVSNTGHVVENCLLNGGGAGSGVRITRIGGIQIRNVFVCGLSVGIFTNASPAAGQVNTLNNSIITGCLTGLSSVLTTDLTEDYNVVFNNNTARTNVTAGANSKTYPVIITGPLLTLGMNTWIYGNLDPAAQIVAIAGTSVPSDDMYNNTRAATSSWGPVQYVAGQRPVDAGPSRSRLFGGG